MTSQFLDFQDKSVFVSYESVPDVFMMHGAGESDQTRLKVLADLFLKHGFSPLTFDFVGHGKSSGVLSQSSLQERFELADFLINHFIIAKSGYPKIILGFSMSRQTAIQLLQKYPEVEKVVLCSPAIYSDQVWNLPFDSGFTEQIKKPYSFMNSTKSQQILSDYTGKVVLVVPDVDKVISPQIADLIEKNSKNFKKIVVTGGEYQLAKWMTNRVDTAENLVTEIIDF